MCGVMAAIGLGLAALGGYSNYQSQKAQIQAQADTQASAARAQAQADEYNARLAEQNAKVEAKKQEQIADKYGEEARRQRARHRLFEGQTRARAGAAGLGMDGSGLDILASGQEAYTQDQVTLLGNQRNDNYDSRVRETNYLINASNYKNSAEANRTAAENYQKNAKRQIKALGVSTILGTAASIVPFFGGGGGSTSGTNSWSGSDSGAGWGGGWNNPYIYKGANQQTKMNLRL